MARIYWNEIVYCLIICDDWEDWGDSEDSVESDESEEASKESQGAQGPCGAPGALWALSALLRGCARSRALCAMALREAQPEIMRGAKGGVLHRNSASRKVSRLSQRIAKM